MFKRVLMPALMALAMAGPLAAQQHCAPRAVVVAQLADKYDESQRGIGMSTSNVIAELFVAPSGTWTMIYTLPGGETCLLASGSHWEAVDDPLPPKGIDG